MLTWLRNRLWPALKTSVVRWNRDDGAMLSAAMAYYAAFSLFPLCLVLVAAVGLVTQWSGHAQRTSSSCSVNCSAAWTRRSVTG